MMQVCFDFLRPFLDDAIVDIKIIFRHVKATKSYLHFCCFAGEAILCFKPYFQIVGSSKEKKSLIELKFYCFFMI